ncbi:MAG: hypothetical protein R3C28_26855 [Pirellulaceae bacterium]
MTLRRAREDRRRRVLFEDTAQSRSDHAQDEPCHLNVLKYAPAASPENQLRLLDLVPSQWWVQCLLATSVAVVLIAITAWQAYVRDLATPSWYQAISAFQTNSPYGIQGWFVTVLWVGCAGLAGLIYSIRRHEIEDYTGVYRIWCYAAVTAIFLSINHSTHLVQDTWKLVEQRMGLATHSREWVVSSLYLTALVCVIRLQIEMKRSKLAVFHMLTACVMLLVMYLTGLSRIASFPGFSTIEPFVGDICAGAGLLAQWSVFSAGVAFAAHLSLDTQGLIESRTESVDQDEEDISPDELEFAPSKEGSRRTRWFSWKRRRSSTTDDTLEEDHGIDEQDLDDEFEEDEIDAHPDDTAHPAAKPRRWFWFGRKQQADLKLDSPDEDDEAESADAADTESADDLGQSPRRWWQRKKSAVSVADAQETNEELEPAPRRRGWFGKRKSPELQADQGSSDVAASTAEEDSVGTSSRLRSRKRKAAEVSAQSDNREATESNESDGPVLPSRKSQKQRKSERRQNRAA